MTLTTVSSLYLNCPACFIYSEHFSRADENKLMNRSVNAESAEGLTF